MEENIKVTESPLIRTIPVVKMKIRVLIVVAIPKVYHQVEDMLTVVHAILILLKVL
jgi:hypothetical protein